MPHRSLIDIAGGLLPYRYATRLFKGAISGRTANLGDIEAFLLANIVPIRAPMVLISQVQRSGGTLLGQLFDSHPQLAAFPDELRLGEADDVWPQIAGDLGDEESFRTLFDSKIVGMLSKGFAKGGRDPVRHPLFVVPRLQYVLFKQLRKSQPSNDLRGLFDAYFTSYFNAWLNYRGSLADARWVTAFAPRLADKAENVAAFFEIYPDGRLVQIIRDPRTWFPSAKNHRTTRLRDKATEEILAEWRKSAGTMLENKAKYGNRVVVLRFEDLVGRTEQTMRALADELQIAWADSLLTPSFNGEPVRANSSFSVERAGVITTPLDRAAMVSEAERKLVDETCLGLYETAAAKALSPQGQRAARAS